MGCNDGVLLWENLLRRREANKLRVEWNWGLTGTWDCQWQRPGTQQRRRGFDVGEAFHWRIVIRCFVSARGFPRIEASRMPSQGMGPVNVCPVTLRSELTIPRLQRPPASSSAHLSRLTTRHDCDCRC